MTNFVGWSLPCGAVVRTCKPIPFDEGRGLLCVFDRYPVANDTVKAVFYDWTFLEDGSHCIGLFDNLTPPGEPIDATKTYKLNGEFVLILTTQALGPLPVVARIGVDEILRFSRYGRGEAGNLEPA